MVDRIVSEIANNLTLVMCGFIVGIIMSAYSKLIRNLLLSIIMFYAFMFLSYFLYETKIVTIPLALVYLSKEILKNSLNVVYDGTILINYVFSNINNRFIIFIVYFIYDYMCYIPIDYDIYFISFVHYFNILDIDIKKTVIVKLDNIKKYKVCIRKIIGVLRCW